MNKNHQKLKYLIIAFILSVFILAGCENSGNVDLPGNVKSIASMNFVEYPNKQIPQFKLINQDGIELTDLNMKSKVYILQGYSFGCSSCAQEVAMLSKVWEQYEGKVEIISMDLFSEDIKSALETKELYNGGDWHWTLDTDNVAVKLEMASLETTVIVDRKGIIRYKDEIISNPADISMELDRILSEK